MTYRGDHQPTLSVRLFGLVLLCLIPATALGQDKGTLDPHPLPPLIHPDTATTPAKQLFGRVTGPTEGPSRIFGFYARGCMAGGQELPADGDAWQVMRPSRNRAWGQPTLIAFLERMARKNRAEHIWPGLLAGDMAQP